MSSILEHIRDQLQNRIGIYDDKSIAGYVGDLRKSEWSPLFESLMRARMISGALRYGKLNAMGKPQWDRIQDIRRRLRKYEQTGNLEFLVDAANLALVEFVEGEHPDKHFESVDDGEHTQVKR